MVAPSRHEPVRPDVDRLAVDTAAALPALGPEERRVGVAVYRLLFDGRPATPRRIGALAGMSAAEAAEVAARLPTAIRAGDTVTGFLGLQEAPGAHRLVVDGRSLGTWCAWDTLFLPLLVGRAARAESVCPLTGEPVTVEVDPRHGVTAASPAGAVLSFLAHPSPFAGDVVAGFCRWVHFLSGPDAAERWTAGAGSAGGAAPALTVLCLDEGVELARRTNASVFGVA